MCPISLGCELLADDCDQLLVLADQVPVSTSELETLIACCGRWEACAASADCRPTCRILTRLVSRSADTNAENGAKKLLTDPAKQVTIVPRESAGWDIDSKDDLERLSDVSSYILEIEVSSLQHSL